MTESHPLHLSLLLAILGAAKRGRPGNEAQYEHFSYMKMTFGGIECHAH